MTTAKEDPQAGAQLVGAVLLVAGAVWLWGAVALLVAGALLVLGPELVRYRATLLHGLGSAGAALLREAGTAAAVARGVHR